MSIPRRIRELRSLGVSVEITGGKHLRCRRLDGTGPIVILSMTPRADRPQRDRADLRRAGLIPNDHSK